VRLLANETVPSEIVQAVRAQGHDVVGIRTEAPESADSEVLARAQTEKRIVLTFDKDFGELAFRWGLSSTSSVILIRLRSPSLTHLQRTVLAAIDSRQDWAGMFSVVEAGRVRITPLPPSY